MKFLTALALSVVFLSCKSIPLPQDQQVQIAVMAACKTLELGKCFEDPALQAVFNGIDADTCFDRITNAQYKFSIVELDNMKDGSCYEALSGLRVK
jgi:hypothetical protein